jgi:predicted esterase
MFMKSLPLLITVYFCLQVAGISWAQIDYKGFPEWSWHKQDSTEYYLYTPAETSKSGLYPIVLFLHGCCGDSYHATLRNTVDPPVRMWHNFGANTQKVPTYIISPATSRGWTQHIANLKTVIDDLVLNHRGDAKRIYITGFSMGGSGTWEFLQQYPGYFAAALPMGMNFHGDPMKIKDVPIWTNRGELDYHAKGLSTAVSKIRQLNGDDVDSTENRITGVNPRFTSFKNYGHGVQWIAASTQDLTGWAYSKVNDGNKYPTVFFKSPAYNLKVVKGSVVKLQVQATDPDGTISNVVIRVNGRQHSRLLKQPFEANLIAPAGDTEIEATAFDNKGKTSTAKTIIKADIKTIFLTNRLPFARAGAYFSKQLAAMGNGPIRFSTADNSSLPPGIILDDKGLLSGLPQTAGSYDFNIIASDEDLDSAIISYHLLVREKYQDEIVVSNIINDSGVQFNASKLGFGAPTHFNKDDDEITISNTAGYEGMTYIPGNAKDTSRKSNAYLTFDVDEDARVYVAYEKKDHLFSSTVPNWLKTWNKEPSGQIVAQYFYFDLYYKDFPKGRITIAGADEKQNNVSNNYFVLIRKSLSPFRFKPEINEMEADNAYLNMAYNMQIAVLHDSNNLVWQITKGALPKGLNLSPDGSITGTPELTGSFVFTVSVNDNQNNVISRVFRLLVKR